MRFPFIIVAWLAAGFSPTVALANCPTGGSSDVLTISNWSIDAGVDTARRVSLNLTSHLEKPVRLLTARAGFEGQTQMPIDTFSVGPEFSIAPGETVTFAREISDTRMPALNMELQGELRPYVCTLSVVYDDGTQEAFSSAGAR